MNRCWLLVLACACLLAQPLARAAGAMRVDINPDNDRRDVLTRGWTDWRLGNGVGAPLELGDVKVSFRLSDRAAAGGATTPITADMWKGGFDSGATMASDGLIARGTIEMVISGLQPGRTSIATYHNAFGSEKSGPFSVAVNG